MEDLVTQAFFSFFSEHPSAAPPYLLGLSGGADSMALFHLLREARFPFHALYVDHGLREAARQEAENLAHICRRYGIPFSVETFKLEEFRNVEDRWRSARLGFFCKECKKKDLSGVMLAHHADDQAETVLKRVFEGASLPKLRGLAPYSVFEGIALFRPLLSLKKKEILSWLDQRGIGYFTDETNGDPRFLRGRMRTALLPLLAQEFGKEIVSSLCRLGHQSSELQDFIHDLIHPYLNHAAPTPGGIRLEMPATLQPFLLKQLIRKLFEREKTALSHSVLEAVCAHMLHGAKLKHFMVGKKKVSIRKNFIEITALDAGAVFSKSPLRVIE